MMVLADVVTACDRRMRRPDLLIVGFVDMSAS